MSPEVVQLLVGLVQAVPGIVHALTPDARAAIADQLEAARARLPAPGSTLTATEAVVARHVASRHPRVTHATADVLARLARPTAGALLTPEDRDALDAAIPAIRAIAEAGEVPAVLDWREPGHGED